MKIVKATSRILPTIEKALPKIVLMMQSMNNPQWSPSYPTVYDFERDIKNEELFCFLKDDKVVGVAVFITEPDAWFYELEHENQIVPLNDEVMYVHRIFVFPEHRGMRYGVEMYESIIAYAKENQHLAVQVDTHERNISMNKTLIRSGFSYTGSRGRENREGLWNMYEYTLIDNKQDE